MTSPIISKRAPVYADVPDEKWNDWRWQLSHRLNSAEEIEKVIPLTESERKALQTSGLFRVDVTPYFISLIDPDDPNDPVRKQIIPLADEMQAFTAMMEDSLAEDRHSPVPGLVHRYPDRVLMLVTTQCASYCRYCTRSRIVGDPGQTFSRQEFEAQIEYLKRTPQVRDVLLSGGDPLVLAPKILKEILTRLREIPHIEIVRIGSRVPVFMPMRVTQELCDMLQEFHPLWINIHINHPNEITQELAEACDRMTRAGIPLAYSEGFSPHPQMSLAVPLAVGVTSEAEDVQEIISDRLCPAHSTGIENRLSSSGHATIDKLAPLLQPASGRLFQVSQNLTVFVFEYHFVTKVHATILIV